MIAPDAASTASAVEAETTPPKRGVFLMNESFETGGSERQFSALAQSLDRDRFRVSLGCLRNRGSFSDALGEIMAFPVRGSLYKLESWKTRARLARFLREQEVQVAHAFDFYTNLTLLPAAYWAEVPVILGSQRQLGDLLTTAQFRAQLLSFRLADAVICNSQAAAARLHKAGLPSRKTVVIPNGLPPAVFEETAPAIPRVSGTPRIAMIARMNSRSKNHVSLLRAVALAQAEIPSLEVLLAGDGPLRTDLEAEARQLGLAEKVRFLGDRRDIPAILASVDACVLPSRSESLSNSILESMAQGVPVIATRVGGNEELLGDGRGILVPPDDDRALASALVTLLLSDDLRHRLGAAGRVFAREHFTIEQMRRAHENLYVKLLERKL